MNRRVRLPIFALALLLLPHWSAANVAFDYESAMREAAAARSENRCPDAIRLYETVLATAPRDVDALVGRGFCLIRNPDQLESAERDFKTVISIAPDYVDAYYGLAIIYRRTGRRDEARAILEEARAHCEDADCRDYLAEISWRIGHFSLARTLDDRTPAERQRQLRGFQHEIYLTYTYDWVEDRPDWYRAGIDYVHHPRPDLGLGASLHRYRRNNQYDNQLGITASYRFNSHTAFEYWGYFADDPAFLAEQKHHPMFYYSFPSALLVGIGARLDEYDGDWARVGRLDIRQYVNRFFGEYSLLTGRDNFDRDVTTHIGRIGYEEDDRLIAQLGYSNGDESIEQFGGSSFSDQKVETIFFSVRYRLNDTWGVIAAGGPEYRDDELFRTTGSLSVFARF